MEPVNIGRESPGQSRPANADKQSSGELFSVSELCTWQYCIKDLKYQCQESPDKSKSEMKHDSDNYMKIRYISHQQFIDTCSKDKDNKRKDDHKDQNYRIKAAFDPENHPVSFLDNTMYRI